MIVERDHAPRIITCVWEWLPIRPYKSHYAPLLMNPRWQHSHRCGISNIKRMQRTFVKVLVKWCGLCAKINVLEGKMCNAGESPRVFRQCLGNWIQESHFCRVLEILNELSFIVWKLNLFKTKLKNVEDSQ